MAPPAGKRRVAVAASRCLVRGLQVLRLLGLKNMATVAEIGAALDLPRPTVHRLLNALLDEGYVRRLGRSEYFAAAARAADLGPAAPSQVAAEIASDLLDAEAATLTWPVDVVLFDRMALVIYHSTHDRSPWSLMPRSPIGCRIPIFGTAPGRILIGSLSAVERQAWLRDASGAEHAAIEQAAAEGFGYRVAGVQPRTAAVAVAVKQAGRPLLAISLAFVRSARRTDEMIEECLPRLRTLVSRIEAELAPTWPVAAGSSFAPGAPRQTSPGAPTARCAEWDPAARAGAA